jgi:cytochrome c oxidase cbb3-type subunit IV
MFKFIKQYAEKMDHAQVYPMISLLIFFLFFVVLLVYVKRMDKGSTAALSKIPLDENTSPVEQHLK